MVVSAKVFSFLTSSQVPRQMLQCLLVESGTAMSGTRGRNAALLSLVRLLFVVVSAGGLSRYFLHEKFLFGRRGGIVTLATNEEAVVKLVLARCQ